MTKTSRLFHGVLLVSAITLSVTACGQKGQLVGGATHQATTECRPLQLWYKVLHQPHSNTRAFKAKKGQSLLQ